MRASTYFRDEEPQQTRRLIRFEKGQNQGGGESDSYRGYRCREIYRSHKNAAAKKASIRKAGGGQGGFTSVIRVDRKEFYY